MHYINVFPQQVDLLATNVQSQQDDGQINTNHQIPQVDTYYLRMSRHVQNLINFSKKQNNEVELQDQCLVQQARQTQSRHNIFSLPTYRFVIVYTLLTT